MEGVGIVIVSELLLSRADCRQLGLTDAYGLHKLVYSLFPVEGGGSRDFIYVDKGGEWNLRRILIISARTPEAPALGRIASKQIPDSLLRWDHYAFEVTLNPTQRNGPSRTTTPIKGRDNLHEWFLRKAPDWGFSVDPDSLQVSNIGAVSFERKNGATQTHGSATFVGRLKVVDRETFMQSFRRGIGRAKGFGFGLLQIMPLRTQDMNNKEEE